MDEAARPTAPRDPRAAVALAALLGLAFAARAVALDQPIVENYVGRQVPTAMVARNLERGSGFLTPRLDVAPLPNLFLVEPPLYASAAVAVRRVTGLPLGPSGRLVSAFGVVLGMWGLFGLAARREGDAVALAAVAAFAVFPITLRYGRAFQPDALMLGCLLAGLRCWDESEAGGGPGWLAAGVAAVSAGLALKVISAYALVPLAWVIVRRRSAGKMALVAATLLPVGLWYAHAAGLVASGGGSRASADNGTIWLRVLVPEALGRAETYRHVVRFLGVRAFTPLGPPLALAGLFLGAKADRLWVVWGASALGTMAVLAAKLHHEYYWLAVAPVVALGVGKAVVEFAGHGPWGRTAALASGAALAGLSAVLAGSTWRTPAEWRTLAEASEAVRANVPADAWVVAPEALLYEADRRGCRLEFTPAAARRAAGEWGEPLGGDGPLALVEFYRRRGARYVADVRPDPAGGDRLALHRAVRGRYNVLVDRPGVLIAELTPSRTETPEPEDAAHGHGTPPDAR